MENQSLSDLNKLRGYAKGSITRIKTFIKDLSLTGKVSLNTLKLRKQRLESAFNDYNDISRKIYLQNVDDDEDPGEIEDLYIDLMSTLEDMIQKFSISGNSEPTVSSKIKLPNIVLPKFNGKYSEFYEFFNMFDSVIGSDASKPPVQKLYYLKSFLSDEPLALVSNLPLTDSSYSEAIALLKERYENQYQIISEHVNNLLEIVPITKSTPPALRTFVSVCKQQLAALKNLGQNVSAWDSILICILSKKLDLITRRAFQLERNPASMPTMDEFLAFLDNRALALENTDSIYSAAPKPQKFASNVVSTSSTTQQEALSCIYCKLNHKIFVCPSFKLAPIENRLQFVTQNQLCKICLNPHAKKCRYHFKCNVCKQSHNSLLHKDEPVAVASPSVTLMSGVSHGQILLPTARVKLFSKTGTVITCRALLDSGSQASFITQKLTNLLGSMPCLTNSKIIGITNAEQKITHSINVEVHSLVYPFMTNVNCHVVPQITTKLPQKQFDISHIKLPEASQLADANFYEPGDVHLLLGADIFFQVMLPQLVASVGDVVSGNPEQPRLLHTSFGYIIAGHIASCAGMNEVVSLFCKTCESNISESLSKFWQADLVVEVYPEKLPELEHTEKHFKENVVLQNNKFQVTMPLKVPLDQVNEELGNSFHLALSRFLNLEKRFKRDPKLFKDYKRFIDEYVALGHGKYIDIKHYDLSKDPVYFLPHHPVIRDDSKTTKLRVVFDASLKTNKKVSLNNILMNGPVVQKDLFDILISFRLGKYFFISDIKMMFRFILLDPRQTSLQNILWRDHPNDDIKCIQLQTVTYGLKTSSYLATRCLIELAEQFESQLPSAASILKHNTYVDDVLATNQNENDIVNMKNELIHLLSLGGFQLHKWASNSGQVLEGIPKEKQQFGEIDLDSNDLSVKTLGVNFDVRTDTFKLSTSQSYTSTQHTKKQILSYISTFFDPLGLMGPIFVQAKTIMQLLWAANVDWDESPPDNIKKQWIEFVKSLSEMQTLHVPQCINPANDAPVIQLIGFADASLIAHGCCLYLRVVDDNGKVSMNLLCSKSRINPLKLKLTTPKLELNAALLLATLADKVLTSLRIKVSIQRIHLFIDSQIVLAWTQSDILKLNTYVAHRIRVIQKLSSQNCYQWGYVDTNENPADCISRGLLPHELKDHKLWWNGPSLLHDKDVSLDNAYREPTTTNTFLESENSESFVPVVCVVSTNKNDNCILKNIKAKYSNINTMIRVLAYVLRFCSNSKCNSVKHKDNFLSVNELNNSLSLLIKSEQEKYFAKEIKCILSGEKYNGSLKPLHPFLDHDGILRVYGRLQHASLPYSNKHPIILPKNSPITELIIRQEHFRLLHAGQKLVLSSLNQKYWITDGLRTVKKVIHKCITCFRLKAAAASQLMGSLPADRVNVCRPFEKVGIDFAGPISVKMSRVRRAVIGKGYILVIVCFTTKSIHLELASDLTTDTFLACFKRFIARRNLPSDVYCDNASTFKGARTRLGDMCRLYGGDKDHRIQVQSFAAERGIRFHFIPSYSPVFGGLWESSVKSVKHHLKHVMGRALLTYEQLVTILAEIEAVLNSRPISAVSADPTDFSYLTPGHFLTGAPLNSYPEQNVSDTPTNLLKFWSICTHVKQLFWKYWKNIYLTTLQSRPKWQNVMPNIKVGTLVILRESNTPPLQWPMARVTQVYPGADNIVRAVEVRTQNGHSHRRSITKICILPIDS